MGLESFKKFQDLRSLGYYPKHIGFGPKVYGGDINRLHARIRLAKSFRGINLEEYADDKTVAGYDAFFQIVLTHSALEIFAKVHGHSRNLDTLADPMLLFGSKKVVEEFFEKDRDDKLYEFLHQRVTDKKLKAKFSACQGGKSANAAHVSAVIRHIFAHGYLCANANDVNPKAVRASCMNLSSFLLRFMDAEFTKKIDACYDRIAEEEAVSGPQAATTYTGEKW